MFRRRRSKATIARLTAENDALRHALTDLGRQLHAAQAGPLGDNPLDDTAPLPRTRLLTPVEPFPPKWWTT